MKNLTYVTIACFFLLSNYGYSQLKVGENPNTIHPASIIEIESNDKVFVLTRVSNTEMNVILPLAGAMVYNTDQGCVYQFNGSSWISLCDSITFNETVTTIVDNDDGSFSYVNEDNTTVTITKAMLVDNGDGSYGFDSGNGTIVSFVGTDNQTADQVALSAPLDVDGDGDVENNVQEAIEGLATFTSDDDISAVDFDGTNLNVTESGTTLSANLSTLEESADIAAVQTDVDTNEADADAAIAAVQADVDQNEADADSAIAAVQADVDLNESDADAAIALKEDSANKSTDTALGTSDVEFPTQNAVKTYVDTQVGTITTDDDISAVDFDGTNLNVTESGTTLSANLSALEESSDIAAVQTDVDANEADADAAIAAVQADVDQNEADADSAIAAVQADVDLNESDADAAIALKEDTANKSTDTALGTSDVEFPTQNAVKTYVDTQVGTITTDDDISAVDFDGTNLNVTESGTTLSANLSALEESADIAAVQTDVDANEADADAAIAALQTDVDTNEADADSAIAAVQADVDLNESDADAAIALKEDSANKSTDVNLADGTNTLFPTELAVKTYVDTQVGTITTDDDISAVDFDGTNLSVTESGTTLSANLSALEESSDIAAVQTDVDANEADADAAIAAVQADVDQNEADADSAIAAVQADVDLNESDADAAIALKEDTANKSTDTALGTSDVEFPTQNAVKTYVDTQVGTITTDDDISAVDFDGTNLNVTESGTTLSANLSTLEESADIAAVQTDVDTNEADADAAIAAVQADVDQNESDADTAIALKEDTANKSTDIALGTSDVEFPTQNAVKTYVDTQVGAITTDDDISAVDFDGTNLNVTESGTTLSADLSALEESSDIAANTTAINNEVTRATAAEAANATAIADHNAADSDLDDTNEIQTLSITGNELSISGTGGNMVTIPSISGTQGSVFFAAADGTATENNSQLFWDATNNRLGIGTDSPTHKLQVGGQVRATSFANANGTAGAPSYRFNNDGNTGMFLASINQLAFSTAGTEAIRIDNSQNVGVGDFSTGTIDASLHVKSDNVPLKIEPSTSTPTGSSGGQMFVADDDGLLYIFDGTRNKWLSVDRTTVGWGRNSANTTNEYLRQFNGALSSQNGWRMIRNGTITAITAQSNINQTWTFEVRKNDATTVVTSITMTNVQGNHNNTINIDINEGDFLQAYCNGTSIDYPEALIEIAWRK